MSYVLIMFKVHDNRPLVTCMIKGRQGEENSNYNDTIHNDLYELFHA